MLPQVTEENLLQEYLLAARAWKGLIQDDLVKVTKILLPISTVAVRKLLLNIKEIYEL